MLSVVRSQSRAAAVVSADAAAERDYLLVLVQGKRFAKCRRSLVEQAGSLEHLTEVVERVALVPVVEPSMSENNRVTVPSGAARNEHKLRPQPNPCKRELLTSRRLSSLPTRAATRPHDSFTVFLSFPSELTS